MSYVQYFASTVEHNTYIVLEYKSLFETGCIKEKKKDFRRSLDYK